MEAFLNNLDGISRQRLKAAIDIGGIGFWDLKLETGNLISSARCKANFGRSENEDLSFKEFTSSIYEEDSQRWREAVDHSVANCTDLDIEYRNVWRDGSIHWVFIHGICSAGENGKASAMSGISIDITERKKAEEKLLINQHVLANAQRIARLGNWDWNLQTNQFTMSEVARKLFGLPENSEGEPVEDYLERVREEDRELIQRSLRQAFDQTAPYDIEFRVKRTNKPDRIVHVVAEVTFDKDNIPLNMSGTVQDITDFKSAEKERTNLTTQIKDQQQYLNNIIANLPGVIWESQIEKETESQQVDVISDYIEKMVGYSVEEWTSKPNFWLEIIHPDDKEKALAEAQDFLRKDGKGVQQFRWIAKNGEIVWVETHMVAVFNEQNAIRSIQGISMNISERKNAEEALQKREAELLQSQKLESIGRLAGGIAHDFNNMLTAINGYSDMILKNLSEADPLFRKVSEIRKAGERSASLTKQLLAFSRQQIMQTKKVCLNQIIRDNSNMLIRLLGEDIKIITSLNNDDSLIEVDPGQITQVILNLVINSRDAMPRGGTIFIKTENIVANSLSGDQFIALDSGNYVKLTVSDTGGGMDEATLANIFEPFYTTKEIGKGTGLGLSTVYGIVKQFDGHIRVESKLDEGTTFNIYFPRLTDRPIDEKQTARTAKLPAGSETILLVEDEKMVRQLIRRILESSGYNIIEAGNGIEAVAVCESQNLKIDLLITDVVMPEMGGHDLAGKLASNYPDLKIIYISGYTNDIIARHGITKEGANFIQKPFSPDELVHKVHQLLN